MIIGSVVTNSQNILIESIQLIGVLRYICIQNILSRQVPIRHVLSFTTIN